MASGVPVVQPRRGAFPEILAQTGGGVLVEAEPDDPASLADAIYRLWKDPEARAELGRRGAAGVRAHYSVSQMAERALEAYQKIVAAVSHA
jgi:glycosyltransferase involved in cell wall biosynthesis